MTDTDDLELEPIPEGIEEPPPLTRTMSVVRWVLFGGMCLFALVMVLGYFGMTPWSANGEAAVQYHCPMHPTYISNQPGDCPICGMSLVPIDASSASSPTDMKTDDNAWMHETRAKHGQYGCPMDPEVVSDTAGRCPVCRMFLVKVDTTKIGISVAGSTESNVPGLVSVMIAPQRMQMIGLKTAVVARHTITDPVRLVGYVTPDETRLADIQVRAAGWVQELYVNETGQRVERGQPLLSLYSPELYQAWQDYQVARRAELASADSSLRAIRREVTEAARRRMRFLGLGETEIDESASNGSVLTLRSPFSGHVLTKSVQAGQYIGPGQSLLTIADLSTVWVVAEIHERDQGRVRTGDSVAITQSGANIPLGGKVAYIYPTVSSATRTLRARVEVANPGLNLRPGMYANVAVYDAPSSVLAIPADAVLDGGEVQYAFVVHSDNQFVPRLLTIGHRSDDWIEIVSGLSEGETVVTSANFLIDSESRLQAAISGMGKTETDASQPAHQH